MSSVINIVIIATFIISVMSVLPKWIKQWRKKIEVSVNEEGADYHIAVRYFEIFRPHRIYLSNGKSSSYTNFHPYNGLFRIETYRQVSAYHSFIVNKEALVKSLNGLEGIAENGEIDFTVEVFTQSGLNSGHFKIQSP